MRGRPGGWRGGGGLQTIDQNRQVEVVGCHLDGWNVCVCVCMHACVCVCVCVCVCEGGEEGVGDRNWKHGTVPTSEIAEIVPQKN